MSGDSEQIKLNFGGGLKRAEGFKNVDILDWGGTTDIVWDLTKIPYQFAEDSIDEIMALELLEHFSFRLIPQILKEWHRILKPGGKLFLQVPDCGKMMEYYVNKQICNCVPHKAKVFADFKASPWCSLCGGKAKINRTRWIFSFTGAQKHEYDTHRAIFTKDILSDTIKEAGFIKVVFKDNPYKLVLTCEKDICQEKEKNEW